jgi:ABC-type transport system involved in multi-copper enzyme maturation permease subunit
VRYLAILKDSWQEAIDRKSLYFLLAVSTLIILFMACIGYEQVGMGEAMQTVVYGFRSHARLVFPHVLSRGYGVDYAVIDPKQVEKQDGLERFEGGWTFRLKAAPTEEFHKLVLWWDALERGAVKDISAPVPGIGEDGKVREAPPADKQERFLRQKFAEANFSLCKVTSEGSAEGGQLFIVMVKPGRNDAIAAGHRVSLLFGLWKRQLREWSVGDLVWYVQNLLAGLIAGWFGILIAIVVTAGFVPNMLQKGSLDVLLSKPINRPLIVVYKYCGGLTYVLLSATYLVGGTWFVMALRSGIWSPGFLWTIPLLVFFFAILYSVSCFWGVITRNPIVPILMSILTWFIFWVAGSAYELVHAPGVESELPVWLVKTADAIHTIVPRIDQVDKAVNYLTATGNGISPEHFAKISNGQRFPEVEWVGMFTTGGVFIVLVMAASAWMFSRRDH